MYSLRPPRPNSVGLSVSTRRLVNSAAPAGALTDRRKVLCGLASGAGLAMLSVIPRPVHAELAEASERLKEALHGVMGGRFLKEGRVVLELPKRAETGLSVPVTISMPDSPMTETDHVRSMHLLTEKNPQLAVADYYLELRAGRAEVSSRIRLAQTQNVFAVAILSDETVWGVSAEVTVALGACAAEIFLPDQEEQLRERLRERRGG